MHDQRIESHIDESISTRLLWPDPLIQLDPSFEPGKWVDELVDERVLHNSQVTSHQSPIPFHWNKSLRALLRAEMDAYYAAFYGLSRKKLR